MKIYDTDPTVFIIDDDPSICEALSCLMHSVLLNVKTYQDAQAYLEAFNPNPYGCILLDVRMPVMSGFELFEQLVKKHNKTPVIFLTGHGDVPMAVRAMQAGALDFILKPFHHQILLEKVQKAINICQSKLELNTFEVSCNQFSKLTRRERQVFDFIATGKSNKQIAFEMNISYHTVEFHRANLMHKLRVKSITELIRIALSFQTSVKC